MIPRSVFADTHFYVGHIAFALALGLTCGVASAQIGEFSFSGGYSHLHTQRLGGLFVDRDGGYVDGEVMWRIPDLSVPVLVGVGVSGSGYYDSRDIAFAGGGGFFEEDNLESDFGLVSIEARAALPIGLRIAPGFFVEPRVGLGLLIDDYSIDRQFSSSGTTFIDTVDHTGAAFEIRPALRAGYSWGPGAIGAEVSYMAAWGDFGAFGSRATEFRAGVFVRFHF